MTIAQTIWKQYAASCCQLVTMICNEQDNYAFNEKTEKICNKTKNAYIKIVPDISGQLSLYHR